MELIVSRGINAPQNRYVQTCREVSNLWKKKLQSKIVPSKILHTSKKGSYKLFPNSSTNVQKRRVKVTHVFVLCIKNTGLLQEMKMSFFRHSYSVIEFSGQQGCKLP